MRNVVIVHVAGDEANAHDFAARLAGFRPLICLVGSNADDNLRFDGGTPLVVIWSAGAEAANASEIFGEITFQHRGLSLVCAVDGTPLPDSLDDEDVRVIDRDITGEALESIQRSHEIVMRAERERRAMADARFTINQAPKLGPALAGGALTGFAATVALLSTVGGAAISVADQPVTTEGDMLAEARAANVRVLEDFAAPDTEAWMDMRPASISVYEAASVALAVHQAASQLPAGRDGAAPEPAIARFERAADELWNPSDFVVARPMDVVQLSVSPMLEAPQDSFNVPNLSEIGEQLTSLAPLRLSLSDLGAPSSGQVVEVSDVAEDAPDGAVTMLSAAKYDELTVPDVHIALDSGI